MSHSHAATEVNGHKGMWAWHACHDMRHLLSLEHSVLTGPLTPLPYFKATRHCQVKIWRDVSGCLACSAQESLILPLRTTSDTFSFKVPIFCLVSLRPAAALPLFLRISQT